jgi:hypothetical protein
MAALFKTEEALAADPKLDQADLAAEKAILLLKAAQGPGSPPFGGHRNAAITHLEQARAQIKRAKQWADNPPNDKPKHPSTNDAKDKGKGKGKH